LHFLFDLDSTITKTEILPFVVEKTHCSGELLQKIQKMTSEAMSGNLPFEDNFRHRVDLLKHIPLATVQEIVSTVPLNMEIVNFIKNHKEQCSIVTSNIDIWIEKLVLELGIPCYSSKASEKVEEGKTVIGIDKVIRKKDILKNYSEPLVAIGDGFNDIELLSGADIGIAFGGVRSVPDSLLAVADYAVYSEKALCRLLTGCNESSKDSDSNDECFRDGRFTDGCFNDKTIVITAAGMGSRLGMALPKALLPLNGKPIIIHQLEMLKDQKDIRIVIGYKAEEVIKTALKATCDLIFVFNHNYKTTNTLNSLYLGARHTSRMVLSLDGDLLVHPFDLKSFLKLSEEYLGITVPSTEEPVLVSLTRQTEKNENFSAVAFSREKGDMEWTGLVQIQQHKIEDNNTYIYELLEKHLPMKAFQIRCCEVDTHEDYRNAMKWVEENLP
jgi:HAD superfamily phosphoserine phosphatase-like hydrolase